MDEMINPAPESMPAPGSIPTSETAAPAPEMKKKKVPVRLILIAAAVLAAAIGGFLAGRAVPDRHTETSWMMAEETVDDKLAEEKTHNVYTYDSEGRSLRQDVTINGKPDSWTEYSYDDNGNVKSCASYESNGALIWRSEYTYDAEGNMLSENHMTPEGTSTYRYEYDEKGNCILSKYANSDGQTSENRVSITYREDGGRREETTYTYSSDGEGFDITRSIDDYDANGNRTHREVYEDGALSYVTDCTYVPFTQTYTDPRG